MDENFCWVYDDNSGVVHLQSFTLSPKVFFYSQEHWSLHSFLCEGWTFQSKRSIVQSTQKRHWCHLAFGWTLLFLDISFIIRDIFSLIVIQALLYKMAWMPLKLFGNEKILSWLGWEQNMNWKLFLYI